MLGEYGVAAGDAVLAITGNTSDPFERRFDAYLFGLNGDGLTLMTMAVAALAVLFFAVR